MLLFVFIDWAVHRTKSIKSRVSAFLIYHIYILYVSLVFHLIVSPFLFKKTIFHTLKPWSSNILFISNTKYLASQISFSIILLVLKLSLLYSYILRWSSYFKTRLVYQTWLDQNISNYIDLKLIQGLIFQKLFAH